MNNNKPATNNIAEIINIPIDTLLINADIKKILLIHDKTIINIAKHIFIEPVTIKEMPKNAKKDLTFQLFTMNNNIIKPISNAIRIQIAGTEKNIETT